MGVGRSFCRPHAEIRHECAGPLAFPCQRVSGEHGSCVGLFSGGIFSSLATVRHTRAIRAGQEDVGLSPLLDQFCAKKCNSSSWLFGLGSPEHGQTFTCASISAAGIWGLGAALSPPDTACCEAVWVVTGLCGGLSLPALGDRGFPSRALVLTGTSPQHLQPCHKTVPSPKGRQTPRCRSYCKELSVSES